MPGTVAVYNYKTGEILCMVSAPSYDPLNVPADLETNDRYQGAYLNRFLLLDLCAGLSVQDRDADGGAWKSCRTR